jgi:hypothetical protein
LEEPCAQTLSGMMELVNGKDDIPYTGWWYTYPCEKY